MKKTLMLIASIAVVMITSVSFTLSSSGTMEGQQLPAIVFNQDEPAIVTSAPQPDGSYQIVAFWSSSDPESRQFCNRMEKTYGPSGPEATNGNIRLSFINLDRTDRLFKAIVEKDQLNPASQHYATHATRAKLLRDFNLGHKLGSYLIGPNGKIVAVNPTEEFIAKTLEN